MAASTTPDSSSQPDCNPKNPYSSDRRVIGNQGSFQAAPLLGWLKVSREGVIYPLTNQLLLDTFGFQYSESIIIGSSKLRSYFGRQIDCSIPQIPFLIRYVSPRKGFGLFAVEPIEKGICIGTFTGVLRNKGFIFPRINPYCLKYPQRIGIDQILIDGFRYGSLMRFINHSERPNLAVKWEKIQLGKHGFYIPNIISLRKIEKNEELLISYGTSFWSTRFWDQEI